jgi:hypothetical protein
MGEKERQTTTSFSFLGFCIFGTGVRNVKSHNIRLISKRKYCGFAELSQKVKKNRIYVNILGISLSFLVFCYAPPRAERLVGCNG